MTVKVEGERSMVLDTGLLAVLHRQHLGDFWICYFFFSKCSPKSHLSVSKEDNIVFSEGKKIH